MSLNVNVIQHVDFLEIIVTGTYDLRDSIDKFSYLLVPSQLTRISKVLFIVSSYKAKQNLSC